MVGFTHARTKYNFRRWPAILFLTKLLSKCFSVSGRICYRINKNLRDWFFFLFAQQNRKITAEYKNQSSLKKLILLPKEI